MIEPHDGFTALPIAQRALLWCMRMWSMQLRHGAETQGPVGNMLGQLGAPTAPSHLECFMLSLVHGATRQLEALCVCQTEVAADEHALLDVVSLAQAKRSLEALLVLRTILRAEDAAAALHSAQDLGAALAQAGHFLSALDENVRRFALVPRSTPAHPTRHVPH